MSPNSCGVAVGGCADRLDVLGEQADGFPGVLGSLEESIVVVVGTIGPMMTLQIVPEVFNGIQLWRISRQANQRNVVGNYELCGAMIPSPVPDQHCLDIARQGS